MQKKEKDSEAKSAMDEMQMRINIDKMQESMSAIDEKSKNAENNGDAENCVNVKPLIVIPSYNNKSTIRDVVDKASDFDYEVLIVDDGSTDGTFEKIEEIDYINIIRFPVNKGKGAAIKAAAAWANERGFSHIITLDADGQHDPHQIPVFIDKIKEKPLSLIIGVRNFIKENVPFSSRFGREFSNFWIRISCGEKVIDSQSGFRAYPLVLFNKVRAKGLKFDFEIEIIVKASWAGMEILPVDISVQYTPESIKTSKFHPFADNLRISWMFTKMVTRNLNPYPFKRHFNKKFDLFGGKERSFKNLHQNIKKIIKENLSFKKFKSQIKKLIRESTTPRDIANAAFVGMFFGTLPLIGLHVISVIFYATRFKLNRLIAYNTNHLGAPPFVPFFAIEIGYYIRNGKFFTIDEISVQTVLYQIHQRILDYIIGATILAPILSIIIWISVYLLVIGYKRVFSGKKEINDIG